MAHPPWPPFTNNTRGGRCAASVRLCVTKKLLWAFDSNFAPRQAEPTPRVDFHSPFAFSARPRPAQRGYGPGRGRFRRSGCRVRA